MPDNVRDPRTYAIIGAAMEVHSQLGCGFTEPIYQDAFEVELGLRNLPYFRELPMSVNYKGHILERKYRPDFVCFESVIVELKALGAISGVEESQLLNYLKVSGHSVGLLINFGTPSLQHRRMVWTHNRPSADSPE